MRLFVSNFPYDVEESDLRDFFLRGGYVTGDVKIIADRDTGQSRGFGFVEIPEDGAKAIEDLNGQCLRGRKLHINEATPRPPGPRERR